MRGFNEPILQRNGKMERIELIIRSSELNGCVQLKMRLRLNSFYEE